MSIFALDIMKNEKKVLDIMLDYQGFRVQSKGFVTIPSIEYVKIHHIPGKGNKFSIFIKENKERNQELKQTMPIRYWLGLVSLSRARTFNIGFLTSSEDQELLIGFLKKFEIPYEVSS